MTASRRRGDEVRLRRRHGGPRRGGRGGRRGETAPGPRCRSTSAYGDAFRWHFIGHLQSRKAPAVSALCELCHSLESISAARRLTVPALVEVNLSGEETKSGVAEGRAARFLAEARGLGVDVRGLMTMPPLAHDPEASRPYFRQLRRLAEAHGLAELSMGTSQDYPVAVAEGATSSAWVPWSSGDRLRLARWVSAASGIGLRVFGILEEEDYWDDEAYEAEQELERTYTDRPKVRRLRSRRRDPDVDDWSRSGSETAPAPRATRAPLRDRAEGTPEPRGGVIGP